MVIIAWVLIISAILFVIVGNWVLITTNKEKI